jgi:DNA-binding GntR family transcriptional regulator
MQIVQVATMVLNQDGEKSVLDPMDKLEVYLAQRSENFSTGSKLLRDLAYERLQDALQNAGLSPGDVLSETRLSKALKISRTPLREALQKLANERVVHVIPGRALTVAAPSIKEVLDAIHVRELLEPEVARLAVATFSKEDCNSLSKVTSLMEKHGRNQNRDEWLRADRRWHEILNSACPNSLLGKFVSQARNWVYNQGIARYLTDQDIFEGTIEHRQVVDAIVARDSDAAQRHVQSHLQHVRENLFRRLGKPTL